MYYFRLVCTLGHLGHKILKLMLIGRKQIGSYLKFDVTSVHFVLTKNLILRYESDLQVAY